MKPSLLQVVHDPPPVTTLEHWLGYYYMQEETSLVPPLVLDLYAALGGKTSYIWDRRWSALAFSDSRILLREQLEDFRFCPYGLAIGESVHYGREPRL